MTCAASAWAAPATDYVLQGYQNYNTAEVIGWYRMDATGAATHVWTDQLAQTNAAPMVFGWMRDGRICGVSSLRYGGAIVSYDYVEIDPETGQYELSKGINLINPDGSANYLNYYRSAAYDPSTDRIYGYGHNAEGTAFVFKSSAPDFSDTRIIREISDSELCSSLTYNETENRLVGFNRKYFVYIDKQTGVQTNAYYPELTNHMYVYTGMMYDPYKRAYYWNYFTSDNNSHMALVDIANKRMTTVCDYTDMTQYSFMVPMAGAEDPAAPARPVFGKFDFPEGALSGNITFTLPDKNNAGDPISGEMQWTLSVDGKDVANGKGMPGAEVTQNVADLSTGDHVFTLVVKCDDKESAPETTVYYTGIDTPVAPANVTLGAATLTWDAVTTGTHDGYIDPAAVTYRVSLNGKDLGTTSQTSMSISYPADAQYAAYTAEVTAICGGNVSSATTSNIHLTGKPLTLPQTLTPSAAQAMLFQAEDTDGNGNVWTYNTAIVGQEVFLSGYSADTKVDEWLFLPPMACDKADGVYSIAFNAALNSADDKNAQIEIRAGREAKAEAMKTVVMPLTDLTASLKEYSGLFSLNGDLEGADGVVIGIRAYAPEGGTQVKARRFKTELTKLSDKAPSNPEEVKITPAPKGGLTADVEFKIPSTLLDGTEIPATTDVTVTILNDSKETVTGKPGSAQKVTIDAYQGINEIEITPAIGSLKGQKKVHEVYCGMDIPGAVGNLTAEISENNLEAYVTWDIPTKGLNGGYVDPADLTYWLCTYDKVSDSYTQYAELGQIPEYVMQLEEGSKLQTYDVVIQAVSSVGSSPEFSSVRVQLGKPYTLTMRERFQDASGNPGMRYTPINPVTSGKYAGTSWVLGDPASSLGEDYAAPRNVALIGTTSAAETTGYIMFPKFSTLTNEALTLSFNVYQSKYTPKVTIHASTVGMTDYEVIGELPASGSGYTMQSIQMPEKYTKKGWVSVYLTVDYTAPYQNLVICEYEFSGNSGIDQTVADLSGLMTVSCGEGTITVTGAAGKPVSVYATDGRLVAMTPEAGDTQTFHTGSGLFIVKAGEQSVKTVVR